MPDRPYPPAMRPSSLLACLCGLLACLAAADQPSVPGLDGIRRMAFLGDSITQGGEYVVDVECWLLSRGLRIEVVNLGLGSETASDLTEAENADHLHRHGFGRPAISERLDRALAAVKPDVVIACYGMNDAGSLPADDQGTQRYAEAVTRLRERCLKAGAQKVVIASPPVKEAKADQWAKNIHDQNLGRYTAWLLSMKSTGWDVVDIHTPMRKALDDARVQKPDFAFAKDSVHPGREGHWVMASAILSQHFGADLAGIANAEQLFPQNGAEIRKLVKERMQVRFAAWMTAIGHQRPGVPGGPKAKPGLPLDQAEAKAAELTARIAALLPARP